MIVEDRYTVISSDCHAGAWVTDYRPYLARRYHDEFDAWAAKYEVPYDDLTGPDGNRNWDTDRRLSELEADGIVAEVHLPEHDPAVLSPRLAHAASRRPERRRHRAPLGRPAGPQPLARRLLPLAPGRRAGIAQILLHDIDAAVAEIRWAKQAGLTGGVLLPGVPPGSGLPQLYELDYYDPMWAVCEELDMPVNHHGRAAPARRWATTTEGQVIFLLEVTWFAHRALRAPVGRRVRWSAPRTAARLHRAGHRMGARGARSGSTTSSTGCAPPSARRSTCGAPPVMAKLPLQPSEYWARQVPRRGELHPAGRGAAAARRRRGPDHVGERLPAQGSELPVLARGAARSRSPASTTLRGAGDGRGQRGQRLRLRPRRARARSRRGRPDGGRGRTCRLDTSANPDRSRASVRLSARLRGSTDRAHPTDREEHMTIRYGARISRRARNRELEATSIEAWSTHADRDLRDRSRRDRRGAAAAARSRRRAARPRHVATVDIGRGLPPFGAGTFAVEARHEGNDRRLPARDADDHRAGGDRRSGDVRRTKKLGRRHARARRRPRSRGTFDPAGHDVHRGRRHRRRGAPDPARRHAHRLLLQVPARTDGKGFDADPSLVYCHRDEKTRSACARRRRR